MVETRGAPTLPQTYLSLLYTKIYLSICLENRIKLEWKDKQLDRFCQLTDSDG